MSVLEKFLRILGNTTGNHILGLKKKVYGDVETKIVNCDSFKSIMKNSLVVNLIDKVHNKNETIKKII